MKFTFSFPLINAADRQALNAWLREPGRFDALVDFDALMRDPARPSHLRAELDNDAYRISGLLLERCDLARDGRLRDTGALRNIEYRKLP